MTVVARINDVPLHKVGERPEEEVLRAHACIELLRQAAQEAGLLAAEDSPIDDGVIGEAASEAIECLLEYQLQQTEPDEEECLRHYIANRARYRSDELVNVRHILYAVTPGMDVAALRRRAEQTLLEVRCHDGNADGLFADFARRHSNCPSGENGGTLDWLAKEDCAPELAREIFGHEEIGVLPRLVHSRFGLHVVEVCERRPGAQRAYSEVAGEVRAHLRGQAYHSALRQYLALLAGRAGVEGIELDAVDTPLTR